MWEEGGETMPRMWQVFADEALASVAVPWNFPNLLRGRDVVWFIDNEAAAATLIRGSAKVEDADGIAQVAHLLYAALHARVWFEWVDSKSNPSDGLSRDGLSDCWTRKQWWQLTEAVQPPWTGLKEEPQAVWSLCQATLG